MRDYFGGPDSLQMIMDQIRANPRMEIKSMTAQTDIFCGCFEDVTMERLTWNGAQLHDKDTVYFQDLKGFYWTVKIRVERPDAEESRMATIEQNIENALAFQKSKKEANICVDGACNVPFAQEGK